MADGQRRTAGSETRLRERAEQLCSFYQAKGRLPAAAPNCIEELGLFAFLHATVRRLHAQGALGPGVVSLLESIPGALHPPVPARPAPPQTGTPRSTAFERWLVRAEIYAERHGYRPTFDDDNALYQWLNRARRKLAAGELEAPLAARVEKVLGFPDIRTYRYRKAHGYPGPGEDSPQGA